MKDLTETLLAAQKKADRLPYIEAKVYQLDQGIRRLEWTRLYEGSEPDNHHGIAFDGQGSMHRIRAATGDNLYYQKIIYPPQISSFPLTFPTPLRFDFPDWQLIANDCQGPCAIAACGAKVYIFYRSTSNVLHKRYSHDHGDTWTDAQLVAYADVLHMAATWWGTGDTVVSFALQASELNAIVLDTSDQSSSQHKKTFSGGGASHHLDTPLGIGATYRPNHCEIVLAAREPSTSPNSPYPYDAYHLWRTELDSDYNFLAIQSFLVVPDGELTTHEYPDCHIPASPQDYENTCITAVEKFTGVTAYTRPLTSHAVRGSDFSSMAFTEPRPFLKSCHSEQSEESQYGLRLQSTDDYWWMERPDGVWRFPRPLPDPTDLTNDIISLTRQCHPERSEGSLVIVLDNSKGQYNQPNELNKRNELVLKLGYKTSAGNEAVEAGRYWTDAWEYSSAPNASLFTLYCLNGWALAARWTARYHMRWPGTKTVWEIIQELICCWGIDLIQRAGVPQSSAINNFYPDFTIQPGTRGDTALNQLLSFVPDALIFDGYQAYTKDLRADEESSYSYFTNPGDHLILSGHYAQSVPLTRAQAIGRADDDSRIIESAFDWDNITLGIDILATDYDPNLTTTVRTAERADAILRKNALAALGGKITIPVNCGQQLYDVITVTDPRCGILAENYRVAAILTTYEAAVAGYFQGLSISAP